MVSIKVKQLPKALGEFYFYKSFCVLIMSYSLQLQNGKKDGIITTVKFTVTIEI